VPVYSSVVDPDAALKFNAAQNPDQRSQTNADPDPGQTSIVGIKVFLTIFA
jgi:hypothetical protein